MRGREGGSEGGRESGGSARRVSQAMAARASYTHGPALTSSDVGSEMKSRKLKRERQAVVAAVVVVE